MKILRTKITIGDQEIDTMSHDNDNIDYIKDDLESILYDTMTSKDIGEIKRIAQAVKKYYSAIVQNTVNECKHNLIKAWDDSDNQKTCTKCGLSVIIKIPQPIDSPVNFNEE